MESGEMILVPAPVVSPIDQAAIDLETQRLETLRIAAESEASVTRATASAAIAEANARKAASQNQENTEWEDVVDRLEQLTQTTLSMQESMITLIGLMTIQQTPQAPTIIIPPNESPDTPSLIPPEPALELPIADPNLESVDENRDRKIEPPAKAKRHHRL